MTKRTTKRSSKSTTKQPARAGRKTPVTQITVRRIDELPTVPPARAAVDGERLLAEIRREGDDLGAACDRLGEALVGELALAACHVQRTVARVRHGLLAIAATPAADTGVGQA